MNPKLSASTLSALRSRSAPLSAAQNRNLALLEKGEAHCAVTGQQLGIFLGPLLTFYKVLSLLVHAEALSASRGVPVVPVFWLQSEDHDLTEAAEIGILRKDGSRETISVFSDNERRSNRISVGALRLPPEVSAIREKLAAGAGAPADHPFVESFFRHYTPGTTLADSFAGTLHELFADTGLLIFDCRNAAVRRDSAPVFETFFAREAEISAALEKRSAELEAAGIGPLVHLKRGSPLFFYHPLGPDGPRHRLEPSGSSWSYEGAPRLLSSQDVLALIRTSPDHFSTSALLRPVLQNALLPVIAYIAGPAEEKYWRQVEPLSEICRISHPLVVPRFGAVLLEPKQRRLLEQLGFPNETLRLLPPDIEKLVLAGALPPQLSPEAFELAAGDFSAKTLTAFFEGLNAAEPALAAELARSAEKIKRAVQGFTDKFRDSLARRRSAKLDKLERLLAFTHPGGVPQERACAFAPFWCTYGERLTESVLAVFRNRIREADNPGTEPIFLS